MSFSDSGERGYAGICNYKVSQTHEYHYLDSVLVTFFQHSMPVAPQNFNFYKHYDRTFIRKMVAISKAMPIKFRALHFCSGSGHGVVGMVLPMILALFPSHYRHRVQLHSGTDQDIIESLASYGISSNSVTPRLGGDFDDDRFLSWLREQRRGEQETAMECRQE